MGFYNNYREENLNAWGFNKSRKNGFNREKAGFIKNGGYLLLLLIKFIFKSFLLIIDFNIKNNKIIQIIKNFIL